MTKYPKGFSSFYKLSLRDIKFNFLFMYIFIASYHKCKHTF